MHQIILYSDNEIIHSSLDDIYIYIQWYLVKIKVMLILWGSFSIRFESVSSELNMTKLNYILLNQCTNLERFLCHSSLPVFSKKQKAVRLKIKNTFLHSYCSSICNSKQTLCFGTFTCHYLQHESFLIPTFKQSWKYSQALAVSMFDIDFRFF